MSSVLPAAPRTDRPHDEQAQAGFLTNSISAGVLVGWAPESSSKTASRTASRSQSSWYLATSPASPGHPYL